MTIVSPQQEMGPVRGEPLGFTRLWHWLTRCAAEGCDGRPVHLGWCAHHAPAYQPGPDEYWADDESCGGSGSELR